MSSTDDFTAENVTSIIDNDVKFAIGHAMELAKCSFEYDVTSEALNKPSNTKKELSQCLSSLVEALGHGQSLLASGLVKAEKLTDQHVSNQKQIIELQEELLKSKSEQLNSVQATVKTELRSYSAALQNSSPRPANMMTAETVKRVVKSVAEEEDRGKNLMVFGVVENVGEELDDIVSEILEEVGEKPQISDCIRIGNGNVTDGKVRPIKVKLSSPDTTRRILSKSGMLKKTENYKTVYLGYDRTVQEREARKKLVEELKLKQAECPKQYHFIKNNAICSRTNTDAK